ncbi:nuclease [Exidia glandulosa HHB12029]|uniref:Nuclease n=1 Tax=Exidia glandulosa HHB12029 TaxID=1314781 RepID=A0A165QIY2_EXIGL|nr:nuclease [Exidia glandulosa HHB12029]
MAPAQRPSDGRPQWWPNDAPYDQTAFAAGAALLGAGGALATALVYRRFLKRYPSVDALPADTFKRKRWIKGVVTSVGDAGGHWSRATFGRCGAHRNASSSSLYHTPGPFWRWPLKLRRIPTTNKDLQGQTLHIRLAGVDAPEAAHFGRPSQPYAAEAIAWLRSTVDGRRVYCQLLSRDQYSRIVSIVLLPPRILPGFLFSGRNVSLEMLKAGWATTYQQAGAEYGERTMEQFQLVEAEAKASKRGMWEKGTKGETPAEYKRRHARGLEEAEKTAPKGANGNGNGTKTRNAKVQKKPWWWPF